MQTSFVYNLRGWFILPIVVVLIATGFSCGGDKASKAAPSATNDAGVASDEITWTTYQNEEFGVTIPYPEGWYVEENETSTEFHSAPPPTVATEYPAQMWYERTERTEGSITDKLRDLEVISSEQVTRSGIAMQRVVFREDFYTPPEVPLYLWERDGYVYELGGPASEVVERAVTSLRQE